MVGERQQVRAEPVAARVGDVLDVAGVDERREGARHGARVDAGQAGELVRADVAAQLEEGVQHAESALDRGQAPLGGSAGGWHVRIIAEAAMGMQTVGLRRPRGSRIVAGDAHDPSLRLDFRDVVGAFATGVTVVTSAVRRPLAGMTLNSFTSVSLDPLLVLVSLAHGTRTLEMVRRSNRYAVNVLHRRQRDVALAFAKPGAPFPPGHTIVDPAGYVAVCTRSPSCAAR